MSTRSSTKTTFQSAIAELRRASVSKRVFVQNLSYENEFARKWTIWTVRTKTRFETEAQGNLEMADASLQSSHYHVAHPSHPMSYLLCLKTNVKSEGSDNVTGLNSTIILASIT